MLNLSSETMKALEKIEAGLETRPKLAKVFRNCFFNTLDTTTENLDDGTAFVLTGDIPAMWLRDSSAQVNHYIPFASADDLLKKIIEGLIKRQMIYILTDPYANGFNKGPDNSGHKSDLTRHNPWVWERKYEIDSLCYPIRLAYRYWKATQRTAVFDGAFKTAVTEIIKLWNLEQKHMENSKYRFIRVDCPDSDTLKNEGRGMPVNYTGMTWSGFRPSDDACTFNYLIPSNMFAVVVLGYIEEIVRCIYKDGELEASAAKLRKEIDHGIRTYGIYRHPGHGDIYAYETDGYGNYNLMDDANVPSLLSIPYIGYASEDDPIYQNTRRFILSRDNPYYYEGLSAKGIGSPHTPGGYIWHISLAMQALTSRDESELDDILEMLERTDAGTGFMHESFHPDDPASFTRPWFAWANSLFSELILKSVLETSVLSSSRACSEVFLK